jgi:hypothetical protein
VARNAVLMKRISVSPDNWGCCVDDMLGYNIASEKGFATSISLL